MRDKPENHPFVYWAAAFQLVISTGILGYLGYLLDEYLTINFPAFLLTGIVAGLISSVRKLLKMLDDRKR